MIKAIEHHNNPAIEVTGVDEQKKPYAALYTMDIDSARRVRDELTEVIKKCVILEAVRFNRAPTNLETP